MMTKNELLGGALKNTFLHLASGESRLPRGWGGIGATELVWAKAFSLVARRWARRKRHLLCWHKKLIKKAGRWRGGMMNRVRNESCAHIPTVFEQEIFSRGERLTCLAVIRSFGTASVPFWHGLTGIDRKGVFLSIWSGGLSGRGGSASFCARRCMQRCRAKNIEKGEIRRGKSLQM